MAIKVAPSIMHARDTMQNNLKERRRVLKSTDQRREVQIEQIELHELERSTVMFAVENPTIEVPFACDTDMTDDDGANPIFSTGQCQAPYNDTTHATDQRSFVAPTKTKKEYRPSSPMSDED